MFGTKLINISQMRLWLDLLPKLYKIIKDLERIASSKYKMNFCNFHMEFSLRVNTFIGMWLINIVAIFVAHFKSSRDAIVVVCDSINYLFSFILILHLCFYVLLFKSLIISFVDYIERRVTNDLPKSLNQLRKEIYFIKTNHYKLYEISKILNAAFGWNFVVIFIKVFVETTIHMYWIFVRTECNNISKMMCNFFFNLFIFQIEMDVVMKYFIFIGPICGVLSGIISIIILVNCCHHCSAWVSMKLCCLLPISVIIITFG